MTAHSLKKLSVVLWIILLLAATMFLVFLFLSAETQMFGDVNQRDSWSNLIKTATDIERLRNIADNLVSSGWATSDTAILLCRLASGAFLIIIIGSIVGLVQVRKMKRHLDSTTNTTAR
jgi:hypothetical protein